ncbi:uncharacterized protein E5676_scaffold66G00530 [Cucumis melo var. makuwa]|uniref:Envelope-like protein n=1 Tax=Cucumis melo var. makuwa TaxID=1194695 RepID=A0A5D3CL42_CUCMM|nr:uncharacterized protein E5676_scaffold66G00530 [Cucumis melo var. makuwa]
MVRSWLTEDQLPNVSLSMKYAILHKTGIANWIPSRHASTVFGSLYLLAWYGGLCDSILSPLDAGGPASKTLALGPKQFQGAHVYDLQSEFCPAPSIGSTPKFLEASVLSNARKNVVDLVLCELQHLLPSSSAAGSSS